MDDILNQYLTTRQYTNTLCKPLQTEDFTPQSAAFASPPKWHIAHTTWFFEEMILKTYSPNYQIFDNEYSYLFNSYYNTIGKRIERHNRGLITRPNIDIVFKYRDYVDQHMTQLLKTTDNETIKSLTVLGVNHEQQHQELLLTDLKYTFSLNPICPKYTDLNFVEDTNTDTGWLDVTEGVYNIGHDTDGFCFDNELGMHKAYIQPFSINKALVTNQEFIEFIEADGYKTANYWLDEGWHWINSNKITQPLYWIKIKNTWHHYTLSGLKPVNPDAILSHISYFEAAAFAFYKGMRLPTEFEWEVASKHLNWGKRWEWTNSAYLPYPNFEIAKGAVGEYNGKFMSNQMVLRGASVATSKNHSRHTYRNFFQSHTQWQFAGIRLAK
ncbi:ergothioneine biosynthesis protein EgtB [Olleya aquimaris]|nr:ergothioneine biosynthesis protein EgtB [Olleya aquimaris]